MAERFTEDQRINHVLIPVAMLAEGEVLKRQLGFVGSDSLLDDAVSSVSYQFGSGKNAVQYQVLTKHLEDLGDVSLLIAPIDSMHQVAMIGSQFAHILQDYFWQRRSAQQALPDFIINAGLAGGRAEAKLQDVIIATGVATRHDAHFESDKKNKAYMEGGQPLFAFNATFLATVAKQAGDRGFVVKIGKVSTGLSMDNKPADLQWMQRNQAIAKEMELQDLAAVAIRYGIPITAVKGICDLIETGEDTQQQLEGNLESTMHAVAAVTQAVVTGVLGVQLSQLHQVSSGAGTAHSQTLTKFSK